MMLVAMMSVEYTITGPTRCGARCDRMIRQSDAPVILAASTNSFSRRESTWPRTMRRRVEPAEDGEDEHEGEHAGGEEPERDPVQLLVPPWPRSR